MSGRAELAIRHADAERDGAACAAIYAPFVAATAVSFEDEPPTAEEMARRIASTSERYPWLLAQDGDGVAGYAYGAAHRERAAYRWACDVAVYVGERHRRQGVGRALYGVLLELLERQGIQVACAGITLPNDGSVALHEACGFEPIGVYRRIGWKFGEWHDVWWWQLELAPANEHAPAEPRPPVRLRGS